METYTKMKALGFKKKVYILIGLWCQPNFHNYLLHMGFVDLVDNFFSYIVYTVCIYK